jgi:predicted amidophosphoribosyltransferase
MPVPIHRGDPDPPHERCCFCRTPTDWWTSLDRKIGEQVACCQHCAARAEPEEVPSKKDWCRRERIAHHPTIGEINRGDDREYPPAPIKKPPRK